MRNALRNEGASNGIDMNLKSASLISFLLMLPFAILEPLNNTITRRNAPGLIVLFGLLWLLPTAFIVILAPVVRSTRAGESVMTSSINLFLRIASLALIAMMWCSLLIDQMPCFMGAANCD